MPFQLIQWVDIATVQQVLFSLLSQVAVQGIAADGNLLHRDAMDSL